MNKTKKILTLCLALLLSSCSKKNIISSNNVSFSSESNIISSITTSLNSNPSSNIVVNTLVNTSITYSNPLEKYERTLQKLEDEKRAIKNLYLLDSDIKDKLIDEANKKYWEEYTNLINETQHELTNSKTREMFVERYNELEVRYIESIDTSLIFFNRKLPIENYDDFVKLGKDILIDIKNNESKKKVIPDFYYYLKDYEKVIDAYYIYEIYRKLYTDNEEYQEIFLNISNCYEEMNNNQKVIFKQLLTSPIYRDYTIETFYLTQDDIDYYLETTTYDDELMEMIQEENELKNKYFSIGENLQQLYLDLVNLRKKIAKKMGYDSYLDYIYEETYNRDYNVNEANNLIDRIVSNKNIISKYSTMISNRNNLYKSNTLVGEMDLLSGLEKVAYVVPNSPEILRKLKTYGNYNFDYRDNKYGGSFEIDLPNNSGHYIFISATGEIDDYSTLFHEYGHYLAGEINGSFDSLDVAEIHSQGLEFLMSNFYSYIIPEEDIKYMIHSSIIDALWSILSASLVTSFENYVYTTDNLSLNAMNRKFRDLDMNIIYPLTFGSYGYTRIPHIYESPGYYVSYLVSAIPSLELWSEVKIKDGMDKYNIILNSKKSNLKEVLQEANVYSPFDERAIAMIVNRLNQVL